MKKPLMIGLLMTQMACVAESNVGSFPTLRWLEQDCRQTVDLFDRKQQSDAMQTHCSGLIQGMFSGISFRGAARPLPGEGEESQKLNDMYETLQREFYRPNPCLETFEHLKTEEEAIAFFSDVTSLFQRNLTELVKHLPKPADKPGIVAPSALFYAGHDICPINDRPEKGLNDGK